MDLGWCPPQRDLRCAWQPDRPFRFWRERYSTHFLLHVPDRGQFSLFLHHPHLWNDRHGRGRHPYANAYTYAGNDANGHTSADCDPNANPYTDAHTTRDAHTYANGHACADCDPNANSHTDAHTSRDNHANARGDANTNPAGANANCGPNINTNPTTEPNPDADGGPCHPG